MADAVKKYTLGSARLQRGCAEGFVVEPGGVLRALPQQVYRTLFLARIDSGQQDHEWGRLSFKAELQAEMVLVVRAFASSEPWFYLEDEPAALDEFFLDPQRPVRHKQQVFEAAGAVRDRGHEDVLLFGQRGQYLYLAFELLGEGEGTLSDACVWAPGENFYATFPEVYRSDGEFFRRYLAVFSTMYNDMQEKIDHLHEILDIASAPGWMLQVFAQWMGIAPEQDLLTETQLRTMLEMGWQLIRGKGTRQVLEKLVNLLLDGERAYIVENSNSAGLARGQAGVDKDPYGFTVLIDRAADEQLSGRLRRLLGQFMPLRCKVDIMFIDGQNTFDSYAGLDWSAALSAPDVGRLNSRVTLNGMTCLE